MVEYMLGLAIPLRRSQWQRQEVVHSGFLVMILLMEAGKNGFGRLRPHFLAVCKPDPDKVPSSPSSPNHKRLLASRCPVSRETGYRMPTARGTPTTSEWAGRASPAATRLQASTPPSGSPSTSSTCPPFFLFGLWRGVEERQVQEEARGRALWGRLGAVGALGSFAVVCALSRITDAWHFPSDVAAGCALGSSLPNENKEGELEEYEAICG